MLLVCCQRRSLRIAGEKLARNVQRRVGLQVELHDHLPSDSHNPSKFAFMLISSWTRISRPPSAIISTIARVSRRARGCPNSRPWR